MDNFKKPSKGITEGEHCLASNPGMPYLLCAYLVYSLYYLCVAKRDMSQISNLKGILHSWWYLVHCQAKSLITLIWTAAVFCLMALVFVLFDI